MAKFISDPLFKQFSESLQGIILGYGRGRPELDRKAA
jgi:hypothetical protein